MAPFTVRDMYGPRKHTLTFLPQMRSERSANRVREIDRPAALRAGHHRQADSYRLHPVLGGAEGIGVATGDRDEVVALDAERATHAAVHLGRVVHVGTTPVFFFKQKTAY